MEQTSNLSANKSIFAPNDVSLFINLATNPSK